AAPVMEAPQGARNPAQPMPPSTVHAAPMPPTDMADHGPYQRPMPQHPPAPPERVAGPAPSPQTVDRNHPSSPPPPQHADRSHGEEKPKAPQHPKPNGHAPDDR